MSLTLFNVILAVVIAISFVGLNAAYLVWAERKGAGLFQRRPGPMENGLWGLLQPPIDGVKLMTKQLLIPGGVDKAVFITAPVLAMFPALVSFVTIPFSATIIAHPIDVGVLLIFAFAALGSMSLLVAGWSSRNKYSMISSIRAVSQAIAYEIPVDGHRHHRGHDQRFAQPDRYRRPAARRHLGLAYLAVSARCRLQPADDRSPSWCSSSALLAETNRAPFDLGEAESELVAGFHTEYSSMGFGLFFMGEYANIVIGACLTTVLFLGGWSCPFGDLGFFPLVGWFLLKIYLIIFVHHLDPLDVPPDHHLRPAQPVVEVPDPHFPVQPAAQPQPC